MQISLFDLEICEFAEDGGATFIKRGGRVFYRLTPRCTMPSIGENNFGIKYCKEHK